MERMKVPLFDGPVPLLIDNDADEWITYDKRQKIGLIYLMIDRSALALKIGHTNSLVEERRKQHQCSNAERLVVIASWIGTKQDERALHKRFAHARTAGGTEWFFIEGCVPLLRERHLTERVVDVLRSRVREGPVLA
jgi:hypothetical protein